MNDTLKRLMGAKAYLKPRMALPDLPQALSLEGAEQRAMRPSAAPLSVCKLRL